tara:strand:- start:4322 stop:5173 length:852 start_codon:yes stop_codon:yes gene_type:complete
MATVTWTGATDGDWNTTSNWSTGALPGAGDDVIFNSTSRDVTISSSVAGTTYGSLKILDGFTGSLGVTGTKLEVMATSLLVATDQAKIHLDGHYTTAIITDMFPGTAASPNVTFGSSSQFTTLRITGGKGAVEVASAGLTTVQMLGADQAVLSVLSTSSSFTNILMDSGTLTTAESFTTADVSGGTLELTGTAGGTTINLTSTGALEHNSTGTVTNLNVFDSACLATTTDNSTSTGAVFTNTILFDGVIDERNGAATTTFSNGIVVNGTGTIRPDVSRTLTVT